jgi:hypothetical protein
MKANPTEQDPEILKLGPDITAVSFIACRTSSVKEPTNFSRRVAVSRAMNWTISSRRSARSSTTLAFETTLQKKLNNYEIHN